MFGYVRPFKGEMLVKEYDAYKGVYCELCRALGRYYGPLMRMTLSYDCTFYALLFESARRADAGGAQAVHLQPVKKMHLCLPEKRRRLCGIVLSQGGGAFRHHDGV